MADGRHHQRCTSGAWLGKSISVLLSEGSLSPRTFEVQTLSCNVVHGRLQVGDASVKGVGGADVSSVSVVAANPASPADMFAVGAWHAMRREQLERRAGVTNAFNAGIANLQATMNNVAT